MIPQKTMLCEVIRIMSGWHWAGLVLWRVKMLGWTTGGKGILLAQSMTNGALVKATNDCPSKPTPTPNYRMPTSILRITSC